ncbi:hypothetical protein [Thioclava sp. SK-1]|uniref:hypothetical protein n=1 Tax=Thioclava sp. SK-1 TaxID=1889770 RepID=UPI00114CB33C|nr:hypothetical protein [Thioclava sp. SK-1]
MIVYLARHGVEDGSVYTHGGLGGGEIDGIEQIDGVWYTYFSERGKKNYYRKWPDEAAAVSYIFPRAVDLAKHYGIWTE